MDNLSALPFELQKMIFFEVDKEGILAARGCSKELKRVSDCMLEILFKEECHSEDYATLLDTTITLGARCLLNFKLVLLAKRAWHTPLKGIQHRKLRPPSIHEMSGYIPIPVQSALLGATTAVFFSEEGCRLQKTTYVPEGSSFKKSLREPWTLQAVFSDLSKQNSEINKSSDRVAKTENLIATALEGGKIIVQEEKEGRLIEIYSTSDYENRGGIKSLLFSKALELFITTGDGSIFSICPFV